VRCCGSAQGPAKQWGFRCAPVWVPPTCVLGCERGLQQQCGVGAVPVLSALQQLLQHMLWVRRVARQIWVGICLLFAPSCLDNGCMDAACVCGQKGCRVCVAVLVLVVVVCSQVSQASREGWIQRRMVAAVWGQLPHVVVPCSCVPASPAVASVRFDVQSVSAAARAAVNNCSAVLNSVRIVEVGVVQVGVYLAFALVLVLVLGGAGCVAACCGIR
jgi:hypothetical protein